MDSRYIQLKKENNQICSYLGDSYKNIADIYIKKARGYASKSVDTEIKIKEVLEELKGFDDASIPQSVSIPNISNFIENRISKLSKKYRDLEQIKGIIAVVILIAVCIAWVAVGNYFSRTVYLDEPTNFAVSVVNDNKVTLTWDTVELAEEYVIYYKDSTGKMSATRTISTNTYTFELEYNKTYTFYLYAKETSSIAASNTISITYELKK
jgi:hypothetical protein